MYTSHCLLAGAAGLTLLAGCASAPQPVADLTRAHTLVAEAERSDAPRYDSADLAAAQAKLQTADQQAQANPPVAARMAQESSVDAELALARTRADKERDALNQVNASLAALKEQLAGDGALPAEALPAPAPADLPAGGPQP